VSLSVWMSWKKSLSLKEPNLCRPSHNRGTILTLRTINYTKLRGLSRLSAKLVPTFADRGCHMVSVTDPYGRNLGFLDRFADDTIY
jgi:hypothetical protein